MNNIFNTVKTVFARAVASITHEQKDTLSIDVYLPGHEPRETTALFRHSKKALIARENGKCYICGRTEETSGHPMEGHHHPIERSLTNAVDWQLVMKDFPNFDWVKFDIEGDPYLFVDDMMVNGMLLCKDHHTQRNEGIHFLPYPLFIIQRYMKDGYKYTDNEIIKHFAHRIKNDKK